MEPLVTRCSFSLGAATVRRLVRVTFGVAVVAATCALPMLLPEASAGPRGRADASVDASADAAPSSSSSPEAGRPAYVSPEPAPLRERKQYVVDLRWVHGDLYLVSMTTETFPDPRETPRVMGRFALELYEGKTLVERVRFDFPGLAVKDTPETAKLNAKVSTRIGVLFPAVSRGTHFELWDRVSDTRWPLPWPPADAASASDGTPSPASGSTDAGSDPKDAR